MRLKPFLSGTLHSFAFILCSVIVLNSCTTPEQKEERIARQYCGSCHMFPEPGLLDKSTWEKSVLPQMAFRMGFEDMRMLFGMSEEDRNVVLRTLPAQPMVSEEEWTAIREYYRKNAPDSLPSPDAPAVTNTLDQFESLTLQDGIAPMVTLIKTDTAQGKTYLGTRSAMLYRLGKQLTVEDSFLLDSPASHIFFQTDNHPMLTLMGIMDPNDQAKGKIVSLDAGNHHAIDVIDSLQRPVHFEFADLNGDQQKDYVVCAFGNYTGALLVYENRGKSFRKHALMSLPGARKVIVRDLDNNGLLDLVALMTQGDEKIVAFYNQGDFKFRVTTLLRFPPVYGSSFFDLADLNKDGRFDILYTNGDNADYSGILKPYHGVRVFLNDGTNQFSESWSYPMHGASQALAADFDHDGDTDIAAIAFFPDFRKHPEHGFLYFENTGNTFVPRYLPQAANGRWLTLEAADYDADGDMDLLLGALNFETGVPAGLATQWQQKPVPLLILRNKYYPQPLP